MNENTQTKKPGPVRRFFSILGPGLITGAADDDPSGVATYSIAGAQLGTSMLWTAFITWPLMGCVQFMCARIGMVTGSGLAAALGKKLPRWLLIVFIVALLAANTINVGADLAGMSDAAEMLTGLNSHVFVVLFGVGIGYATIKFRYYQIAMILKWLSLVLVAYVITVFVVGPDWRVVLHDTFVPSWPTGHDAWATLVAILGTTISPYLFFWQTSQEVEEQKAMGLSTLVSRKGATTRAIINRKLDVGIGTFFSNLVMYFIILTTAATLHAQGKTSIDTAQQAAEALKPLAGNFAYLLFTLGLIGTGMLGVPVLAGAAAYAIAEARVWRGTLEDKPRMAKKFYAVVAVSMLVGLLLNFVGIHAVRMLFLAAVLNGVLAPPLIVLVVLLTSNKKVMGKRVNPPVLKWLGWATAAIMAAAAIGMFATM